MKLTIDQLLEVRLLEQDDFLKVRETLTRIGIASRHEKKLFQSCHILHKQGRYYVVHFKELFALGGKETNYSEEDNIRRNIIASLLEEWGLVKVVSFITLPTKRPDRNILQEYNIRIIPFKEKHEWDLVPKYNIGKNIRPQI